MIVIIYVEIKIYFWSKFTNSINFNVLQLKSLYILIWQLKLLFELLIASHKFLIYFSQPYRKLIIFTQFVEISLGTW